MSDFLIRSQEDAEILSRARNGSARRPVFNGSQAQAIEAAHDMSINATLRHEEWLRIDERVAEEGRYNLTVLERFRSAGLIEKLGVGDIERGTERLDAFSPAQIHYDGSAAAEGEQDRANYSEDRHPVPIISHGFTLGFRQRASGRTLQTDSAGLAARAVTHRFEKLLTQGLPSGGPSGNGVPGLLTAPNAIAVSLATPWDESGGDPVGDVLRMVGAGYAGYFQGPYDLHVPKNWWSLLDEDYSTDKGTRTYAERILSIRNIQSIVYNAQMPDDEAILVQMTRDVMDVNMAMNLTTWQWEKNPGETTFRVLMIGGPHIKSINGEDGVTRNGIIHLS